jgi:hypothetical protein
VSIPTVVDFPAPVGPSKPKTSPAGTENGWTGAVVATRRQVILVVAFTFAGDRIKGIDLVLDPSKLRRIRCVTRSAQPTTQVSLPPPL